MTIRQMVSDLISKGYTFDRIPPVQLQKISLEREHQYQIHLCPKCSSVNVDIVQSHGRFCGSCYTCGFKSEPCQTPLQAMKKWNEERMHS